jgi:hypothetical protein
MNSECGLWTLSVRGSGAEFLPGSCSDIVRAKQETDPLTVPAEI